MPKIPFHSWFLRMSAAQRKPRHRLLRVFLGVLGIGVLLVLVVLGVFVGLAMLGIGAVSRLTLHRNSAPAQVLDGDYRVVSKPALPAR